MTTNATLNIFFYLKCNLNETVMSGYLTEQRCKFLLGHFPKFMLEELIILRHPIKITVDKLH